MPSGAFRLAGFGLGLLALFFLYLLVGRYPRAGLTDPRLFLSDETARRILLGVRLPRALGALLLGAVLGGAGAAFQSVFGNPLVEPGFLGVSQGAALGAALALVLGAGDPFVVALAAFVLALVALRASLLLARAFRFGGQVLRLVLAGIAVSAFAAALLAFVKYAADPLSQLPDITFWTMGGLSGLGWAKLAAAAPVALVSLAALFLLRWRATILSLDDEAARSLGARPELERGAIIVAATAGVAAMTAVSGIVSWVGLVVPQAARALVGADGRASIPASMALGAAFVLVCDALSRSLLPGELPLGVPTALLGALAFAALLASRRAAVAR
ncbi:MAG: iron ABC transporter permease [Spirochaetaceae bacterium]|nr:iron ABC transporter permease [Spirochaetaceae bacterium]